MKTTTKAQHTKHTPGPWFVNGPWHIQSDQQSEIPVIVAQVTPQRSGDLREREANAALLAAAPELLAACRLYVKARADGGISMVDWSTKAHEAISSVVSKLEGRA